MPILVGESHVSGSRWSGSENVCECAPRMTFLPAMAVSNQFWKGLFASFQIKVHRFPPRDVFMDVGTARLYNMAAADALLKLATNHRHCSISIGEKDARGLHSYSLFPVPILFSAIVRWSVAKI